MARIDANLLRDAAGRRLRREPRSVLARFHLKASETLAELDAIWYCIWCPCIRSVSCATVLHERVGCRKSTLTAPPRFPKYVIASSTVRLGSAKRANRRRLFPAQASAGLIRAALDADSRSD